MTQTETAVLHSLERCGIDAVPALQQGEYSESSESIG